MTSKKRIDDAKAIYEPNAVAQWGMPQDVDLTGFRLHPQGALKGHYAVAVSGNWRMTFRFDEDDVVDVDYSWRVHAGT